MWKKLNDSKLLLTMLIPAILYFAIFHYKPMYGVLIAFKDFKAFKGFDASPWVGLKHFRMFFSTPNAWRLVRNTFLLAANNIIWGFPAPIIFALILNEVKNTHAKKWVQTISYMPHFISTVVIVAMIDLFLSPRNGMINNMLVSLGFERIHFMAEAGWFRTVYVVSEIWQGLGWGAIIYLAALTNIDPQLYEAAMVDGATKIKQIIYITLPCLAPTITTLFLLRMGRVMSVGFEKVFLMQTPVIYETADVIQTFVYRQGMIQGNMSFATAIGLFNSVINIFFLIASNAIARKLNETSLW
ncbi:MAG: sugar ABC transporter permease [Epulopiscium sp.]|nr:sugar ABC transporter permease [Candidatus Epulonipiscium sp.]